MPTSIVFIIRTFILYSFIFARRYPFWNGSHLSMEPIFTSPFVLVGAVHIFYVKKYFYKICYNSIMNRYNGIIFNDINIWNYFIYRRYIMILNYLHNRFVIIIFYIFIFCCICCILIFVFLK